MTYYIRAFADDRGNAVKYIASDGSDTSDFWFAAFADDRGDAVTYVPSSAIATSSAAIHPGYVDGNYYRPLGSQTDGSGAAATANRITASMGGIAAAVTISQLFVRVTTGATSNIQMAVYSVHPTSKLPYQLLGSTASVSGASAAMVAGSLSANVSLTPGEYWWCFNADATVSCSVLTSAQGTFNQLVGASTLDTGLIGTVGLNTGLYVAKTLGTWPADASGESWAPSSIVQAMGFLVESVP